MTEKSATEQVMGGGVCAILMYMILKSLHFFTGYYM